VHQKEAEADVHDHHGGGGRQRRKRREYRKMYGARREDGGPARRYESSAMVDLDVHPLRVRNVAAFLQLDFVPFARAVGAIGHMPRVVRQSCIAEAANHRQPCIVFIEVTGSASRGGGHSHSQLASLLRSSTLQRALAASELSEDPMAWPKHGCVFIHDVLVFRRCSKPFRLSVVIAGADADDEAQWREQAWLAMMACTREPKCEVLVIDAVGCCGACGRNAKTRAPIFRDLMLGSSQIASAFTEVLLLLLLLYYYTTTTTILLRLLLLLLLLLLVLLVLGPLRCGH